MKKLLLILIVSLSFVACSKNDEACYVFNTTTVTSVYPSMAGYPQTANSTSESCGLTHDDAKQVATTLTSTTTSTQGSIRVTITQTCTYHKK